MIISLPTDSATVRMRIWRALRNLGCGSLRDGVYLLPYSSMQQQALRALAADTVREGGSAWLLIVHAQSEDENDAYRALFDRTGNYLELFKAFATARKTLTKLAPQEITKLLRKLRREYEAVREIDYFPNDISTQAEATWMDFVNVADKLLSPDEPHAINAAIARLELSDYKGRTWATRRHLWVDRVASAWLIRRFIDREAHFLWLESPDHCPADALGFDFDGATFTHIGDRVTFEVLLASFGLEQDRGLLQLGAMIRALDTGDGFVPEANGFEAILAGARQRTEDDNHLLNEMSVVLDLLYAHFSNNLQNSERQK
nr:chromate resistance protein ChrB domain-containing protein [Nitrosomonas communis]